MENSNVSNFQGIYNPAHYVNCTMQSKKSMRVLLVRVPGLITLMFVFTIL